VVGAGDEEAGAPLKKDLGSREQGDELVGGCGGNEGGMLGG